MPLPQCFVLPDLCSLRTCQGGSCTAAIRHRRLFRRVCCAAGVPALPGLHCLGLHPDMQAPISLGQGAKGPYLLMIRPADPGQPQNDQSLPSLDSIKRLNIPEGEAAELTLERAVELLQYPKVRPSSCWCAAALLLLIITMRRSLAGSPGAGSLCLSLLGLTAGT